MPKNNLSLQIPKKTQLNVVSELIESSRLTRDFYIMLVLSSIVISFGLLLNNLAVIIGGMLITPLLTPLLALALGAVTADWQLIWRSTKILLKAIGVVIGISVVMSFLSGAFELNEQINMRLISNLGYFLVAFVAGLAATFAWSKKNMSAMMPGVAIAVSLLPPLSVLGIGISRFSVDIIQKSLQSFLLNIFGILLGSVIVFLFLNFSKAKKQASKAVRDEIREEAQVKDEKIKEKIKQEIEQESEIKEEIKKEIKEDIKEEIKEDIKNGE